MCRRRDPAELHLGVEDPPGPGSCPLCQDGGAVRGIISIYGGPLLDPTQVAPPPLLSLVKSHPAHSIPRAIRETRRPVLSSPRRGPIGEGGEGCAVIGRLRAGVRCGLEDVR